MKPINEWTLQECILAMKHGAPMDNFRGGIARVRLSPVMLHDVANRVQSLTDAQSKREAELVEALRGFVSACRCKGTGTYESDCPYCGDSTYDHHCKHEIRECFSEQCEKARQAIAKEEGK